MARPCPPRPGRVVADRGAPPAMAFGPAVTTLFVALVVAAATARSAGAMTANAPAASPEATDAESTPAAPVPAVLFVFSPDWRPADLGRLGATLEDAGTSGGLELSVQGFARYEDFESQVAEKKPDFLIAPAWIETGSEPGFRACRKVLARGSRLGRTTYRKALLAKAGIATPGALTHRSIAATQNTLGPGPGSEILEAFHLDDKSAKVVGVPKDVDALLALRFGQADAALVTGREYEAFAKSNPAEAAGLEVLGFSPETGLPPVYACASAAEPATMRMTALLPRLAESQAGRESLALLGLDAFQPEATAPEAESSRTKAATAAKRGNRSTHGGR